MKTVKDKPLVVILKIVLLILIIIISSMFIHSCNLMSSYAYVQQIILIDNSFISQDNDYILHFTKSNGTLESQSTDYSIEFSYKYESGIALCNYYESYIDDEGGVVTEEKIITFQFIQETILYCQSLNQLFGLM